VQSLQWTCWARTRAGGADWGTDSWRAAAVARGNKAEAAEEEAAAAAAAEV
jgi:hypothetical protein